MSDLSVPMTDPVAHVRRGMGRMRGWIVGVPVLVVTYLVYVFFSFGGPDVIANANMENRRISASAFEHSTPKAFSNCGFTIDS